MPGKKKAEGKMEPVRGETVDLRPETAELIGVNSDSLEFLPDVPEHLLNKYTFLDELGTGTFGTAYKVRDSDGNVFALKLMMGPGNESDFINESAVTKAMGMGTEHAIKVYDFRRIPGGCYILMEYAEGGSLRDYMDGGFVTVGDTEREAYERGFLRMVAEACWGLEEAHPDVIHRDIKPDNILVSEGKAKIADYGQALEIDNEPKMEELAEGTIACTPVYASPEVAQTIITAVLVDELEKKSKYHSLLEIYDDCPETFAEILRNPKAHKDFRKLDGWWRDIKWTADPDFTADNVRAPEDIDHRSDIYSMGVVLYEGWTNRLPNDFSKLRKLSGRRFYLESAKLIADGSISDIQDSSPDTPDAVARIARRALENDPDERYQSAGVMALDIENFLEGMPTSATSSLNLDGDRVLQKRYRAKWVPQDIRWNYRGSDSGPFDIDSTGRKETVRCGRNILSENQWFRTNLNISSIGRGYEMTFYLYSNPHRRNTVGEGYAFTVAENCAGPEMRIKKHGFTVASSKEIRGDIDEIETVIVEKVGKGIQFMLFGEDGEMGRVMYEDSRPLSSDNYSKAAVELKGVKAEIKSMDIFATEDPYGPGRFATADYHFSRQNYRMAFELFSELEEKARKAGDTGNMLKARCMKARCLRRVSNWLPYEANIFERAKREYLESSEEGLEEWSMDWFSRFDTKGAYDILSGTETDKVYRRAVATGIATGNGLEAARLFREVAEKRSGESIQLFESVIGDAKDQDGKIREDLKENVADAMISKGLLLESRGDQRGMLRVYTQLAKMELGEDVTLDIINNCLNIYRKLQDRGKREAAHFGLRALDSMKKVFSTNPERLLRAYKDLSETDLQNDPYVMNVLASDCELMSGKYLELGTMAGEKSYIEMADRFSDASTFYAWKSRDAEERLREPA